MLKLIESQSSSNALRVIRLTTIIILKALFRWIKHVTPSVSLFAKWKQHLRKSFQIDQKFKVWSMQSIYVLSKIFHVIDTNKVIMVNYIALSYMKTQALWWWCSKILKKQDHSFKEHFSNSQKWVVVIIVTLGWGNQNIRQIYTAQVTYSFRVALTCMKHP